MDIPDRWPVPEPPSSGVVLTSLAGLSAVAVALLRLAKYWSREN